jgi:hypothetical protein
MRSSRRSAFVALGTAAVAIVGAVVLMRVTRGNDESTHPAAPSTAVRSMDPSASDSSSGTELGRLPEWRVPMTSDVRLFVERFAAAVWTYDSRFSTYEQWRASVGEFADPDGPAASAAVARALLPTWAQWEDMVRMSAHAQIRAVRVQEPPEVVALRHDPRAPTGWRGFVVHAVQEVTSDGRPSSTSRQMSVAAVCSTRCFLWSATPEVPR